MKKWICALVCILALSPTARAAEPKYVALTFDDGPSGRFTRRLLDGLEERGAKATFFLCGYRLQQYPELAERMVQQGHELGIHGFLPEAAAAMGSGRCRRPGTTPFWAGPWTPGTGPPGIPPPLRAWC